MVEFNEILKKHHWNPIKNCPGRYVLKGGPQKIPLADLIDQNIRILEFQTPKARDIVLVAEFSGGGMISYRKKDRSYIHTLCEPEGFKRKLKQLEIEMPPQDP